MNDSHSLSRTDKESEGEYLLRAVTDGNADFDITIIGYIAN